MGSISDNFHSRWGRRHPFMYAAALPMAVSFLFLFNPPSSLGQTELFLWLTSFAILVRVSMTLNLIPSNSMVAEMTAHYDERTSLVSYRFFFGWAVSFTSKAVSGLGGFLAGIALDLIAFPRTPVDGVMPDVAPEKIFVLGLIVGPVLWCCGSAR